MGYLFGYAMYSFGVLAFLGNWDDYSLFLQHPNAGGTICEWYLVNPYFSFSFISWFLFSILKKKEVVTSGLTWRDTDASSSKSREQFKELRECLTPERLVSFPSYVSLSSSLFYSHRSPSTFFLLTFEILNAHDKHQTPRIGEIALLYNTTYFREIYLSFLSFFFPSFCALLFYTCTYIFFYHPICIYKCATPRLFCRNPDVFSPSLTLPRIWLVSFSFFFSRQDKQEKKKSK